MLMVHGLVRNAPQDGTAQQSRRFPCSVLVVHTPRRVSQPVSCVMQATTARSDQQSSFNVRVVTTVRSNKVLALFALNHFTVHQAHTPQHRVEPVSTVQRAPVNATSAKQVTIVH